MEISQETIQALKEAAINFVEAFKKAVRDILTHIFESVRQLVEHYKEVEELKQNNMINRTGWHVNYDMRKRSQVMSNKPKFMVRKIIH